MPGIYPTYCISNLFHAAELLCLLVWDTNLHDYKNLHALLKTLPDPSVDTGPIAMAEAREKGLISEGQYCIIAGSALHAGAPKIYWIRQKRVSLFVKQLRCAVSCKLHVIDPDGTPPSRDQCKEQVNTKYIPTLFLSYNDLIPDIYRLYSCHMTS